MRRAVIAVAVLGALVASGSALAFTLPSNRGYYGISTHGRYGVLVETYCTAKNPACVPATADKPPEAVGMEVNIGRSPCPDVVVTILEFSPITLKDGSFHETTGSPGHELSVSGTFESRARVAGKVAFPAKCGGTDTYVAKLAASDDLDAATPPHPK